MQKYHSPWYLEPKLWTKNLPPGGLQDPKENKEQQMTESKKKSKGLVSCVCNIILYYGITSREPLV